VLEGRPGTKQALLELMQSAGTEERGEAMTLMTHHIEILSYRTLFRIARRGVESHRSLARIER